jgi:hypothetical protein
MVLLALGAAPACERAKPVPPSGVPPIENAPLAGEPPAVAHAPTGAAAPAGAAAPTALPPGHPALPPGHPEVSESGGPAGAMPAVGEAVDPNAKIHGQLVVADAVKGEVRSGDVIFLVVRADEGEAKGTILGVKRLVAGAFPMRFEVDGRDAMIPGVKFAGKVVVGARVDKDGDATTKNPGDVVGSARAEVGAKDVQVVLDTVTK